MRKLYQVQIQSDGLFSEKDLKEVNKQLKKAECSDVLVVAGTDQALLLSVDTIELDETQAEE